jgi:hypothetical protein
VELLLFILLYDKSTKINLPSTQYLRIRLNKNSILNNIIEKKITKRGKKPRKKQ